VRRNKFFEGIFELVHSIGFFLLITLGLVFSCLGFIGDVSSPAPTHPGSFLDFGRVGAFVSASATMLSTQVVSF
jgi:hypothetical protein